MSDPVGFVIRGNGPVYVKTVDPTGPAAQAGLKVKIVVHFVSKEIILASMYSRAPEISISEPLAFTHFLEYGKSVFEILFSK